MKISFATLLGLGISSVLFGVGARAADRPFPGTGEAPAALGDAAARIPLTVVLEADSRGDIPAAIQAVERMLSGPAPATAAASIDAAQAAGIATKNLIRAGRLTEAQAFQRRAWKFLDHAVTLESGQGWSPGRPVPPGVGPNTVSMIARTVRYDAQLLGEVGRNVEAASLLRQGLKDIPRTARLGHYQAQLLSELASQLKFLGLWSQCQGVLAELKRGTAEDEAPVPRLNEVYWRSQVEGPDPAFLSEARRLHEKLGPRSQAEGGRIMAKLAYSYKDAGFDVGEFEGLIQQALARGDRLEALFAKRDRAVIQAGMRDFEPAERDLLDALKQTRAIGRKSGEPTLYREYGQLLISSNRPQEGVRMIREAIRLTRSFQWTQHLPPLLHLLAQGQIAANDRMGVMATLAELQKLLRTGQLEPDRRLRAGIAVALCQQALGQGELARGTLANAVTSGQRDGLSAWMLREAADFSLNEVPAPGAQRSEAAGGPNAARGENFADLQPIQVQSSVLPHEKARARFTLSNPTAAIVKGHLRFEAEGMGTNWDADHGLANVTLGPTVGAREDRHSLTLLPGEEFLIVAETVGAGRDRKLELFWTPEIGAGQHCLWRVGQTPDDGMEIAVTNASLALRNPFYAIRLHHALVRRGGSDAQPVNLRVRSSHPVRVEMLDPATDRLLAVDAQADADFHAGGDFVHTDADADGAPDLTAPTGEPVEVALLVYPLDRTKAPGEITLTLQIKDPDGWHDAAQDTLK